jgi:hypothetical protein
LVNTFIIYGLISIIYMNIPNFRDCSLVVVDYKLFTG